MGKRYRLAVLNSHPIQYFAPLYRRIADTSEIDITVYYCSKQGVDPGFLDPGFGREVVWDVPLLEGYRHEFLRSAFGDRGVQGFFSLINVSIIAALWTNKYDALLIHGHNSATSMLALFAAKVSGTRVFMRAETHLLLHRSTLKRIARRVLMPLFYKICDACLYIGTRNREFYQAHGVPPRKLFFVPYAVDNQSFAERAREASGKRETRHAALGLPPSVPIILYASKLASRKRPRDLLRAYAELSRHGVRAALLFVGDGEERVTLEQEARSIGLKHVVFVGFVNQSELPAYYAISDIFVLPSENEPWGLVINEVMSCGVPVVTAREVGAAVDLVREDETGYTYETGNVTQLTDALTKLLANDELRKTMRRNCVRLMETWSYLECIRGVRYALEVKEPRCV